MKLLRGLNVALLVLDTALLAYSVAKRIDDVQKHKTEDATTETD